MHALEAEDESRELPADGGDVERHVLLFLGRQVPHVRGGGTVGGLAVELKVKCRGREGLRERSVTQLGEELCTLVVALEPRLVRRMTVLTLGARTPTISVAPPPLASTWRQSSTRVSIERRQTGSARRLPAWGRPRAGPRPYRSRPDPRHRRATRETEREGVAREGWPGKAWD